MTRNVLSWAAGFVGLLAVAACLVVLAFPPSANAAPHRADPRVLRAACLNGHVIALEVVVPAGPTTVVQLAWDEAIVCASHTATPQRRGLST